MNRDAIIKLAREAGFRTGSYALSNGDECVFAHPVAFSDCIPELERFAALVEAAEREQCALAAWEIVQYEVHADLADQVAQAIRARSQASATRMCPSTYYECSRGCGDGACKDFSDAHGG